ARSRGAPLGRARPGGDNPRRSGSRPARAGARDPSAGSRSASICRTRTSRRTGRSCSRRREHRLRRMTDRAVERYLRLGLQLDRHVDGVVDAYYGPAELKATVAAESPVAPAQLVDVADGLLDELEDGWLRDQVVGLRTYAGVLAGESRSFADEAEGCYRVRPTYTAEAGFQPA